MECAGEFAPAEGWIKAPEQPFRAELCLNGLWQFQPVSVPEGHLRGAGEPPELPLPEPDRWEAVPIKIPSPWNVNAWGGGRAVGAGTQRPFWPDSIYFPSYPAAWDHVEMGWLRRRFHVPPGWGDRRLVLHFEAVAGECQVWVNGRLAGRHFDKYLPFEWDITDLAKREGENELLVGVRAHGLFDRQSQRYPKMRAPYPCGSNTERLAGIWQDVFLLGLPPVRVESVFVKPLAGQEMLELEIELRNDGPAGQTVALESRVHPWVNLASGQAGPQWRLDEAVYSLPAATIAVPAGSQEKLVLRGQVKGQLKLWAPGAPHLYAAMVTVRTAGSGAGPAPAILDKKFTRFGWRQFSIQGNVLRLNGQPVQLMGDFLHPFGPFVLSRGYVAAWYRCVQDFGGNSVRPHAQPHPRHYLELADEMGLVALDETAIFGSAISLNFEDPAAWERFAAHYDGLVRRDRNHPSVLGWSFGNELFAIFEHNQVPADVAGEWYRKLAELGARARRLDATRDWISCDGDEDLRGALPVWSKHFGHGTPLSRLPSLNKPLMVGESGGTYYARPRQMAEFNGPRAYESYEGRNEALALDVFDNITRMARPRLAYYSASETTWFGLEHLPFGYRDFTRLPGREDGVFFTRPYEEGKPGMQPERLPPYVATLNPGWDEGLPPYQPLAMFHAQKAALANEANPAAAALGSERQADSPGPAAPAAGLCQAGFLGDLDGRLARRLRELGVSLDGVGAQGFTLAGAGDPGLPQALRRLRQGGILFVFLSEARAPDLQPLEVSLTGRSASALVPCKEHPWTAPFTLADLYFAEDGPDRYLQRQGMAGPAVERGRVLLRASDTDWSLFLEAPEYAKCAAVVLQERLLKPPGAALVEVAHGEGRLLLCSLDWRVSSAGAAAFWRRLLTHAGLVLGPPRDAAPPAFDERGVLVSALTLGRFGAGSVEEALATRFVDEAGNRGDTAPPGFAWKEATCPSRDRFLFHQLPQAGPDAGAFATYFSFWLRSPRTLDNLLEGGPEAPQADLLCFASETCRVFLNGAELACARREPADYRTRLSFERLPLQSGWNHLLIKAASSQLRGSQPGTLAVRLLTNRPEFFHQLESTIDRKPPRK